MTQSGAAMILALLTLAYPNVHRGISPSDAERTIALWVTMFKQEDDTAVAAAVKDLIGTYSGFPPDIAAVKKRINDLRSALSDEPTDEKLWQIYRRALSNSGYDAKKEFDKLPPILKAYAGSPETLRVHAMMDEQETAIVLHGQFLKQLPAMRERAEDKKRLDNDPDLAMLIGGVADQMRMPLSYALSDQEANDNRNAVLDAIDKKELRAKLKKLLNERGDETS